MERALLTLGLATPILLALYYLALSLLPPQPETSMGRRFVRGLSAALAVAAAWAAFGTAESLLPSDLQSGLSTPLQLTLLTAVVALTWLLAAGVYRALQVPRAASLAAVQAAAVASLGLLYVLGPLGLAIDFGLLAWLQFRSPQARLLGGTLGPLLALAGVVLFFVAAEFVLALQDGLGGNNQRGLFDVVTDFQSKFWTAQNGRTMLVQISTVAMAALGMTVIMIAGGIDLSAGTAMALAGTAIALSLREGASGPAAVSIGLAVGVVTGIINGALIGLLRIVPFIVTLGTMTIYLGIGKLLAEETTVRPARAAIPQWVQQLLVPNPTPSWLLLPSGIWIILILATLLAAVLKYTVLGRHVFAVGSNEATARLCGVNVPAIKVAVFAIGGFFVGLAGLFQFSRLYVGNPESGSGTELEIIAAVVIGGASLSGGKGTVMGTLAGAGIMAVIYNGCTMLGMRNPIQEILVGVIIITAVAFDQLRQRRQER